MHTGPFSFSFGFFLYIRRRLGTLDYVSMAYGYLRRRMSFCAPAVPKRMKTPSGYAKSARCVLSLIDLVYYVNTRYRTATDVQVISESFQINHVGYAVSRLPGK